ncbi:MAG: hypothetical protein ACOYOH_28420 [Paracraurococcus sp.]
MTFADFMVLCALIAAFCTGWFAGRPRAEAAAFVQGVDAALAAIELSPAERTQCRRALLAGRGIAHG